MGALSVDDRLAFLCWEQNPGVARLTFDNHIEAGLLESFLCRARLETCGTRSDGPSYNNIPRRRPRLDSLSRSLRHPIRHRRARHTPDPRQCRKLRQMNRVVAINYAEFSHDLRQICDEQTCMVMSLVWTWQAQPHPSSRHRMKLDFLKHLYRILRL